MGFVQHLKDKGLSVRQAETRLRAAQAQNAIPAALTGTAADAAEAAAAQERVAARIGVIAWGRLPVDIPALPLDIMEQWSRPPPRPQPPASALPNGMRVSTEGEAGGCAAAEAGAAAAAALQEPRPRPLFPPPAWWEEPVFGPEVAEEDLTYSHREARQRAAHAFEPLPPDPPVPTEPGAAAAARGDGAAELAASAAEAPADEDGAAEQRPAAQLLLEYGSRAADDGKDSEEEAERTVAKEERVEGEAEAMETEVTEDKYQGEEQQPGSKSSPSAHQQGRDAGARAWQRWERLAEERAAAAAAAASAAKPPQELESEVRGSPGSNGNGRDLAPPCTPSVAAACKPAGSPSESPLGTCDDDAAAAGPAAAVTAQPRREEERQQQQDGGEQREESPGDDPALPFQMPFPSAGPAPSSPAAAAAAAAEAEAEAEADQEPGAAAGSPPPHESDHEDEGAREPPAGSALPCAADVQMEEVEAKAAEEAAAAVPDAAGLSLPAPQDGAAGPETAAADTADPELPETDRQTGDEAAAAASEAPDPAAADAAPEAPEAAAAEPVEQPPDKACLWWPCEVIDPWNTPEGFELRLQHVLALPPSERAASVPPRDLRRLLGAMTFHPALALEEEAAKKGAAAGATATAGTAVAGAAGGGGDGAAAAGAAGAADGAEADPGLEGLDVDRAIQDVVQAALNAANAQATAVEPRAPPPAARLLLVVWFGSGSFEWRAGKELLPFGPHRKMMEGEQLPAGWLVWSDCTLPVEG
jgi:hypothetical protein